MTCMTPQFDPLSAAIVRTPALEEGDPYGGDWELDDLLRSTKSQRGRVSQSQSEGRALVGQWTS